MKILLITGGDSSEREISLKSAENVENSLRKKGHQVYHFDLTRGRDGLRKLANSYDVLFPVLHGEEGEGGILHKYLVGLGKPIVGTRNYKGLHDAWYKIPFKEYCDKNAVPHAPWQIVKTKQDIINFGFPSVLKASIGGSSKEVAILESDFDLENQDARRILKMKDIFIEKYIKGVEVTVGILNGKVLPIIEIVPTKYSWFSYDAKYDNTTKEIAFAPSIDEATKEALGKTTLKICKDFNLGSYLRVDYIVDGEKFYALDVNTIVGLTAGSLFPKMAMAAGVDYLEELLKSAR